MDLRAQLLAEVDGASDLKDFLGRVLRCGAAATRCPNGAAYGLTETGYRQLAASGNGRHLPATLPALPATRRNARNIPIAADDDPPDRPRAFLRLEWDGPEIHDPEAVDALEDACVAVAGLMADVKYLKP